MDRKKQNILFKIISFLLIEIFMIAEAGFCLSPSVRFDSTEVKKIFEQTTDPAQENLLTVYWQESSAFASGAKEYIMVALEHKGYKLNILEGFDEKALLRVKPPIAILNPESAKELGPMLRTLNPDIKIVITSSYFFSEQEIASMGGDYYLPKPISIDKFLQLLKSVGDDIASDTKGNNKQFELPQWSEYAVESMDNHPELKAQLYDRALEYQRRLVRRKKDGALFFLKTRFQPDPSRQMDFIWPKKNDPAREYAAFKVGRAMDANVCDIVLPNQRQAEALAAYIGALAEDIYLVRLSSDYKLADPEVRQKEYKKAFTRNFVLSVLIRKYDFYAANHRPIADAEVAMMFDNDQAFHKDLIDMKSFGLGFMENFFPSFRVNTINAMQLFEQISVPELIKAVSFCENELDIETMLKTISDHDLRREVQSFLHLEYAQARVNTLRADILELFRIIIGFNQVFSDDAPEYEQLHLEMERIEQALSLEPDALKEQSKTLHSAEAVLGRSI